MPCAFTHFSIKHRRCLRDCLKFAHRLKPNRKAEICSTTLSSLYAKGQLTSNCHVLHVSCVQPECVVCLHLPLTMRHQSLRHICRLLQAQALLAMSQALMPTEQQTSHQPGVLTLADAAPLGRALIAVNLRQIPHRPPHHLLLREIKTLSTHMSAIAAAQVRMLLAMWQACRMAGRLRAGRLIRQPLHLKQQEQVSPRIA